MLLTCVQEIGHERRYAHAKRERWRPVFFNEMKRGLKRQSDGERERE